MEDMAMSDLLERARAAADNDNCPEEAKVCLMALCGVIEHHEWSMLDLQVKYRKSEYNYAGVMLTDATKRMEEYKNGKGC